VLPSLLLLFPGSSIPPLALALALALALVLALFIGAVFLLTPLIAVVVVVVGVVRDLSSLGRFLLGRVCVGEDAPPS